MYNVFLVDDEVVIREGIRDKFPWDETDFRLAGEAPDGEVALSMLQDIKPDILITDIRMPFMDGLKLCRRVKDSMPWIHIVLLSGYDDFAYAKEAISLGVKEYLLKPIGVQELVTVLRRIAGVIEEERRQQQDLAAMRRQIASASEYMREKLVLEILQGVDAQRRAALFDDARKLHMNLAARCYRILLIEVARGENALRIRSLLQRLYTGNESAMPYPCEADGKIALLMLGEEDGELEERSFALAQAIKQEMERENVQIYLAVSSTANSVFAMSSSYRMAQSVLRSLDNRETVGSRIIDALNTGIDIDTALPDLGESKIYEKLRYATADESQGILASFFDSMGEGFHNSVMMLNFIYVDVLLCAARIIRDSGGEPDLIIPEAGKAENKTTLFTVWKDMAKAAGIIIGKAAAFRDEQSISRYSAVIRKACEYIGQHYADPDIRLGVVTRHVNLSDNHFCTVFSQEMGIPFLEYLTGLRMEKAKELLRTTDMRSSEVASAVGYNDPHYFSYLFKKSIGMNPRDYKVSVHRQ